MNPLLLLLLFLPLTVPFVAKFVFHRTITWLEFGATVLAVFLIVLCTYQLGKIRSTTDYELWSGQVAEKKQERVSCEHSYSCRCRTVTHGTGKNRYTTTHCDTCYEHSYDFDWAVYASYGLHTTRMEIDRVDRQGVNTPPRWSMVAVGEPTSEWNEFTNYIQIAPNSVFNNFEIRREDTSDVPPYPSIFDYYHVNRAIGPVPDIAAWNKSLEELQKKLGPEAKANLIVLFTKNKDPNWAESVRVAWMGGKKNDVVLILGVPEYPKLSWVRVVSWSEDVMILNKLRDDILVAFTETQIDRDVLLGIAERDIRKHYRRMDTEKFKYLEDEFEPSGWLIAITLVLGFGSALGITYFFHKNETF